VRSIEIHPGPTHQIQAKIFQPQKGAKKRNMEIHEVLIPGVVKTAAD
jgi:hypothetical protein